MLADLLISKQDLILDANSEDIIKGQKLGLSQPLLSRLSLNESKLKNLSKGLKKIADCSLKASINFYSLN